MKNEFWIREAVNEWKASHANFFVWAMGSEITIAGQDWKQAKIFRITGEFKSKFELAKYVHTKLEKLSKEEST